MHTGFVYFVIQIAWSRPFLMSLMYFFSYMLPLFHQNLCHLSLLDKYPPCWSFRLCFHHSILLRNAIKIMTILLSVSIMAMYFATCLAQESCQDVSLLKVIYDVLWRLHFIVERLLVMISMTIEFFLNKNNFLISKNYFYFALFIGINSFLEICSNDFKFSTTTFYCQRLLGFSLFRNPSVEFLGYFWISFCCTCSYLFLTDSESGPQYSLSAS